LLASASFRENIFSDFIYNALRDLQFYINIYKSDM
jgi:hypothetical protein